MSERSDMDDKPTGEVLDRIKACKLLDKAGKETTFGDVIRGKRTVTIFIRHWFCTTCQGYCKHIAASLPPSNLPDGTSLVVVGCGGHQPMDPFFYKSTGLPSEYQLYTDPTQTIHNKDHFNFHIGMSPGKEKTDYARRQGGLLSEATRAIGNAIGNPSLVRHAGPSSQNGGEFIFEADGTCSFAHRMRNSTDHTEVKALARAIGAEYTPLPDESS